MKQEINIDVLMELFHEKTSNSVFLDSLELFKVTKKSWKSSGIFLLMSIVPAYIISSSPDTVELFENLLDLTLNIMLALFGIVFTGYAFFQALINRTLLIRLFAETAEKKGKTISKLQESNESFVELMMVIILSILISFFGKVVFGSVDNDYVMFPNYHLNVAVAFVCLLAYLYFTFIVIWEIKSFVFNIFQLFNAHAGAKLLDVLQNKNED